jgi:SHS2 domain-containing protein
MGNKSGFQEIEHTADAAIQVWGNTLPVLFQQAAYGLYAVTGVQVLAGSSTMRRFNLNAKDKESLLVAFLSELLFYLNKEEMFQDINLKINGERLFGQLRGRKVKEIQREIKAVTYHQMKIIQKDGRYQTDIVFDV